MFHHCAFPSWPCRGSSVHVLYWSCLDNVGSGRVIQSVGSPYQGTPLAGNLAAMGDVFGAGCGVQNDLTTSGAATWLSPIPSWARSQVNYYTTSFTDKWWRYEKGAAVNSREA